MGGRDDGTGADADPEYDADGYERQRTVYGFAVCPVCGRDVDLIAETESWTQAPDGRWRHHGFGPGQGVCCDTLIVDSWDGCVAYELGGPDGKGQSDDDDDDVPGYFP